MTKLQLFKKINKNLAYLPWPFHKICHWKQSR